MIARRLLIAGICLPFVFSGVAKPAATVIAHSHQLVIFVEHLSIAFALAFVAWWRWSAA